MANNKQKDTREELQLLSWEQLFPAARDSAARQSQAKGVRPAELNVDRMDTKTFNAAIQAGIDDMEAGRVEDWEDTKKYFKEKFVKYGI